MKEDFLGKDFRYSVPENKAVVGYRRWNLDSQRQHYHESHEILYVVSGERVMFVGDRQIALAADDILLIPPATLHKSLGQGKASEIFSLYVPDDGRTAELLGSQCRRVSATQSEDHRILKAFRRLEQEIRGKPLGFEVLVATVCRQIPVLLRRLLDSLNRPVGLVGAENGGRIADVTSFLQVHFREDLRLTDLAGRFHVSPSHLSRSFHRETGFTLVEYLNHLRVLAARENLLSTKKSMADIADLCGFGSLTHFSRTFKSIVGQAPGSYRKSHQELQAP